MIESRQVRRSRERQENKTYWDNPLLNRLQVYWIEFKNNSNSGVEYIDYKPIIDKAGLDKKVDKIIKNKKKNKRTRNNYDWN